MFGVIIFWLERSGFDQCLIQESIWQKEFSSIWEEKVGCILSIVYLKSIKGFEILDVQIELMANPRKRSKVPN